MELEIVDRLTGDALSTCPWRGFAEPDVLRTLEAHQHWEKGQGREWWGDDPELWLVEAVAHYERSLEVARADEQARRQQSTGAPPEGAEVSVRG